VQNFANKMTKITNFACSDPIGLQNWSKVGISPGDDTHKISEIFKKKTKKIMGTSLSSENKPAAQAAGQTLPR
jgi:hypothetical protein